MSHAQSRSQSQYNDATQCVLSHAMGAAPFWAESCAGASVFGARHLTRVKALGEFGAPHLHPRQSQMKG
eukprot:4605945-Amphidinium_carterae.1